MVSKKNDAQNDSDAMHKIGVLARDFGWHAEDSRKKKIFSNPSTLERGPETPANDGLNFNMRRMHRKYTKI
jgi:hypothetical protein